MMSVMLTYHIACPTGNAPWPIGVTSIGIHERSSREKISHATGMNVGGAAHIMNDEATRKYLQVTVGAAKQHYTAAFTPGRHQHCFEGGAGSNLHSSQSNWTHGLPACVPTSSAVEMLISTLQAMKRLLSFMQRAYPTDPSRSVDFDGFRDQSRGAIGAGSDKLVSDRTCTHACLW